MKRAAKKALSWLGADNFLLLLFVAVWLGLVFTYGAKLHLVEGSILLPCYVVMIFLVLAAISHFRSSSTESFPKRARRILRDWLPVIFLIMIYETLRDYTGMIRPDYIDQALLEFDVALFGIEPTLWIQKFIHPFWTDYFTLMYILYIVPSIALPAILYRMRVQLDFKEAVLQTVLCFYIGFFLYIMFPAGPPRFYEGLVFNPTHLTGMFGLYEFTHNQMNSSNYVNLRASFPSLHCALTALAIMQAWKFKKLWKWHWTFGITTWVGVGVWIATVYLRHHWVADIFAGWILAVISFFSGTALAKLWRTFDQEVS